MRRREKSGATRAAPPPRKKETRAASKQASKQTKRAVPHALTRHAGSRARTVGRSVWSTAKRVKEEKEEDRRGGGESGTGTRREELTAGEDVAEGVPDMHAADGGGGEWCWSAGPG